MSTHHRVRRLAGSVACAVVLGAVGNTAAYGGFRASVSSSGTPLTTNTLQAPTAQPGQTGPTVSVKCNGQSSKGTLTISWGATPSTWAAGYTVRITESGTTTTHQVTPRTTLTDPTPYTTSRSTTTVTVAVSAFMANWTSPAISTVQAVSC